MHGKLVEKTVPERDQSDKEIVRVKKPIPSKDRENFAVGPLAWLIDAWDDRDFGRIVSDFVDPDIF